MSSPAGRFEGLVFSRKKSAGQRIVRNDANALIAAERQQLRFDIPMKQIIARLHAIVAGQAVPGADADRERELPGGIIRAAEIADFALPDAVIERAQRLFERRLRIEAVRLIEIDVIGLQPAETIIDGLDDMPPGQSLVVRPRPNFHAALGRQHEAIALPLQPAADDFLGASGRF